MKHERTCEICGAKYQYCPNCLEYAHLPRWMFLFHDANCKKIYEATNAYRAGAIDADAAKAKLMKADLTNRNSFLPAVKQVIDKIWAEGNVEEKKQNYYHNDNKKK